MKANYIHIPIVCLGVLGYMAAVYILISSLLLGGHLQYIFLVILPLCYGIGTVYWNHHRSSFEESPVRYIFDVCFFVKMVCVPFLFYSGGCELGEYNPQIGKHYIAGVLLEVSQYVLTIFFLNRISASEKRKKYLFFLGMSKGATRLLIFLTAALYLGLGVLHPEFVTDYFSFFDFDKSEGLLMRLHGVFYSIFTTISVFAYLVVPVLMVAWINRSRLRFKIVPSLMVILLPFCISTVNHFHAVIIAIAILTYLYVAYREKRKYLVLAGGLLVAAGIPLILFKNTSGMLLFLNSYIQGFINDAGIFLLPPGNIPYSLFTTVTKSIPLAAGFFKNFASDDSFTYVLFLQEGRNDQFPSMAGQLWYYFGPLYPVLYYYLVKFLKTLEKLVTVSSEPTHNLLGFLMIYLFCYIVFAGNINSFISMFVEMLIVMIGVNRLENERTERKRAGKNLVRHSVHL